MVAVDRGRFTCAWSRTHRRRGDSPARWAARVSWSATGWRWSATSPAPTDALARIVRVEPRNTVLRRTADDTDPVERVVVANAEQLVVVAAVADPEPRVGLMDRALVAAFVAGLEPLLCFTNGDLARPEPLVAAYGALGVASVTTGPGADDVGARSWCAADRTTSVLLGHSGVGKSTLVNRLVPGADRAVGHVNAVTGRGRHTSSSAIAFPRHRGVGGGHARHPVVRPRPRHPRPGLAAFPEIAVAARAAPRVHPRDERARGARSTRPWTDGRSRTGPCCAR